MEKHKGSKVIGDDTSTNVHVGLCLLFISLSIDTFNPIKLFCSETGAPPLAFGLTAVAFLVYIVLSDLANVMYFSVRIFFRVILSTVFSNIEIVGLENVPRKGPIIFTGNHANQFVDALQVVCSNPFKVSFLIAEKSWNRPVIGDLAKMIGCIPVARAQDSAKKGVGRATTAPADAAGELSVRGEGTEFVRQLKPGDKIRFVGAAASYKVTAVAGDDALTIAVPEDAEAPTADGAAFDCLPKMDQSVMYRAVYDALKDGRCIGIFPEGGSHDRTDLLPLQAGVALMTFGCQQDYNLSVPVVPIGLTYFKRNTFRSRVNIEFGPPVVLTDELVRLYADDKRAACNRFLGHVEDGMRGALVTTDSYDTLTLVHTARRLYQRDYEAFDSAAKQDLNRRFSEGYKQLLTMNDGELPPELVATRQRLVEYRDTLKRLGLRDHQVPTLHIEPAKVVLSALHIFVLVCISAPPSIFLNLPIGFAATRYALKAQKKALAASKVKLKANDVVLSEAIKFAIVAVPTLWMSYAVLLLIFSGLPLRSVLVLFLFFPFMSYVGVIGAEAGVIAVKDLQPLVNQLRYGAAKQRQLRAMRTVLQSEVRSMIRKYGPSLGDLYYTKELRWDEYLRDVAEGTSTRGASPPPKSLSRPDLKNAT